MSPVMPAPGHSPAASPTSGVSSRAAEKPHRVLACVLCQQRKVKCDREFPCSNCVKAGAQCVPAAALAPRQRRRRFPERELLERLRYYEGLLRQNNIDFEPLHAPAAEKAFRSVDTRDHGSADDSRSGGSATGADRPSRDNTTVKSETAPKNFWHAMNLRSQDLEEADDNDNDNDGVREAVFKKALDRVYESNDDFLFGSRKTNVDLSTMHPEEVQIFRLWQIYLENVNPLLKVTHTPTLQARIIDAASDVTQISPTLEALMFSIYRISISSLNEDECRALFGLPRKELLTSYQFGCQQALLNCRVLRSGDLDCLTALYLYLISVRPGTDPRSMSSMLGVAMRIAQRMGIHNESSHAKRAAFEAEMRRRLWWSLVIFDARISEMSDYKTTMLAPTWDCKIPLNVNDFNLRPEMKTPPKIHEESTEAIFAVVRSELADFVRRSAFHLDFVNPILKSVVRHVQHGPISESSELVALEKRMEDKYFKFCNLEDPLHFMTIWTARGYMAKNHLVEHYSRCSRSPLQQTEEERDTAISHALRFLECDTNLMSSPLIKGYVWVAHFQFPLSAYIHTLQDLRRRPFGKLAKRSWEVMGDNYKIRFVNVEHPGSIFFRILSRTILRAWEMRDEVFRRLDKPEAPPHIVSDIKHKLQIASNPQTSNIDRRGDDVDMSSDDFSMPMPVGFDGYDLLHNIEGEGPIDFGFPTIPGQATLDFDANQLDLTSIDWSSMHGHDW